MDRIVHRKLRCGTVHMTEIRRLLYVFTYMITDTSSKSATDTSETGEPPCTIECSPTLLLSHLLCAINEPKVGVLLMTQSTVSKKLEFVSAEITMSA